MIFEQLKLIEDKESNYKIHRSQYYNYYFNKKTGLFIRWGETKDDDPLYAPFGPEILDMELSTICDGIGSGPCPWCYKSNTSVGQNMSFEKFKKIFHKLPKTLTQIAFSIGNINSNPDFFKIMEYCRNNDYNYVVPNVTINGYNLTDNYAKKLSDLCGAVAVSMYDPKDMCYDAVEKLTDLGMTQINIHRLVAEETFEECFEVMQDSLTDTRLLKLNAIVFLALKPVGSRNNLSKIGTEKYKKLIDYAFDNNIKVGFDSCSAPMFLQATKDRDDFKMLEQMCEPCESYLFSFYINVEGKTTPCSFLEKRGYSEIDVAECNDFLKDIWNSEAILDFRKKLANTTTICIIKGKGCRSCPEYNIY